VVSSVVWLRILLGPYWCVCVWCTVRNESHSEQYITTLRPLQAFEGFSALEPAFSTTTCMKWR